MIGMWFITSRKLRVSCVYERRLVVFLNKVVGIILTLIFPEVFKKAH